MICDKIFEKIDELSGRHLDFLEEICSIESPTDYKEGVDRVGRRFMDFARERGWEIEVCPQKISGDAICITLNPNAKKQPIAISGHMDTVHPVGSFGEQPIVRREGGKMYGPGTKDCKGGIVAGLLAMDALSQCGFDERPVLLLLQSDEEKSSMPSGKETIKYICKKAEGSAAFLNIEGTADHTAVLQRKGILRLKLTVHGKAAHSAMCYDGVNAVAEAAYKIIELEKMKNKGGLTCNCTNIKGGTAPNVVAEWCEFIADIRFSTLKEKDEAYERVRATAERSFLDGTTCEIVEVSYRPPMEYTERNANLLKRMNAIFKENGLAELRPISANGGSDAAYATIAKIPCVDSISTDGGATHSRGEYALIDTIGEAAKRIASVIYFL